MFPELGSTGNAVHLATDKASGSGKLIFKVDPVVDHHNLKVGQIGRGAQYPGDEHHRERFTGSLCMPDYTGSLLRRFPRAQPFDNAAGRAVLLVPADNFRALAIVRIHEDRAGAQQIQQCVWSEQPLNHLFLLTLNPKRWLVGAPSFRPDVFPGMEMLMS